MAQLSNLSDQQRHPGMKTANKCWAWLRQRLTKWVSVGNPLKIHMKIMLKGKKYHRVKDN